MVIPKKIRTFLNEHKINYELIYHPRVYTAQETAARTHTKGKEFAKTVILLVDGKYCMMVLPAIYSLDLIKVRKALKAKRVNLASEEEMESICPDCEVGAMPPFGPLYELPVYIDRHLTEDQMITFNAGSHEHAIRMFYKDFEKLVKPQIVDIAGEHVS